MMSASSIDELIAESRKLTKPKPVKKHRVPEWMRKRLKKLKKAGEIESPTYGACDMLMCGVFRKIEYCLDHWGKIQFEDREVFVSEPYFLEYEENKQFADFMECEMAVFPNSWHFPSRTLRIVFWPVEWNCGINPCALDELKI